VRLLCALLSTILISMACTAPKRSPVDAMTRKDINEVLREHERDLLVTIEESGIIRPRK
jgi:hypothetical protein